MTDPTEAAYLEALRRAREERARIVDADRDAEPREPVIGGVQRTQERPEIR